MKNFLLLLEKMMSTPAVVLQEQFLEWSVYCANLSSFLQWCPRPSACKIMFNSLHNNQVQLNSNSVSNIWYLQIHEVKFIIPRNCSKYSLPTWKFPSLWQEPIDDKTPWCNHTQKTAHLHHSKWLYPHLEVLIQFEACVTTTKDI